MTLLSPSSKLKIMVFNENDKYFTYLGGIIGGNVNSYVTSVKTLSSF